MAVDGIANTTQKLPSTEIPVRPPDAIAPGAAKDAKDATLNYDSFLKLLVAQMKNQDPTNPVDATQQMSQLASFSNVEQAIKTNRNLESLIKETSMSQATSLIGKQITSADGKVTGVVKSVEINSDGLTAMLDNGKEVAVTSGITVSAAGTTVDTGTGNKPADGETDNSSGT